MDPKDVRAVELLAGPLAEQTTDRLFRQRPHGKSVHARIAEGLGDLNSS